jgi:2-polyprenyl-6-methoxyphenol hydroxylase-like FAD-dependent oxidoreductase
MYPYKDVEMDGTAASPLKVLIAGAGIGGLSAAIALRKAGHEVEVISHE